MTPLLWVAAVALIAIGVAGTILPAIPGVTLVFLGMLLGAWIDDFARIPVWLVVVFALLTAVAWAVDYLAAAAGAKRAGASKLAVIGAMVGTVAGIFTGLDRPPVHAAGRRGRRRIHRPARRASCGHRRHCDLARTSRRHRGQGRDRVRDDRRVRARAGASSRQGREARSRTRSPRSSGAGAGSPSAAWRRAVRAPCARRRASPAASAALRSARPPRST